MTAEALHDHGHQDREIGTVKAVKNVAKAGKKKPKWMADVVQSLLSLSRAETGHAHTTTLLHLLKVTKKLGAMDHARAALVEETARSIYTYGTAAEECKFLGEIVKLDMPFTDRLLPYLNHGAGHENQTRTARRDVLLAGSIRDGTSDLLKKAIIICMQMHDADNAARPKPRKNGKGKGNRGRGRGRGHQASKSAASAN
jgi:hypothetical protein